MEKSNIMIRLEKKEEQQKVENLVRDSFWNVYCPGCLEHYVLNQLRNDPAFVPELDFVMYLDGELIGQNIFVRTAITADDGRSIPIMTMGPICIKNEYKQKGYGKILLDYSLEKAAELGCGALCFEGNIDFMARVDSGRQASMVSVIMDCQRGKMHPSFCVKNLYRVILMGLLESMQHRKAIL